MTSHFPSQEQVDRAAESAPIGDRSTLLRKLREPERDWDERVPHGVPGPVWTVLSDTCWTGRPHAPDNIGYDNAGQEFVFRQPRDLDELAGVMAAACEEVFDCYRLDGLQRWTGASVWAWISQDHVIEGWLRHVLATEKDPDILASTEAYLSYLTSKQMRNDLLGLIQYLETPRTLLRLKERKGWRGWRH